AGYAAAMRYILGTLMSRGRHFLMALACVLLLAACEGGGSGQSGGAFVFITVAGFSLTPPTFTATVNSSIDTGTSTVACVTLQNTLNNPTVSGPTALDNVIIQSSPVALPPVTGGSLPGPFTFGPSVLVPAGTVTVATGVVSNNTATFPVILVPATAKLDPRVR